MANDASIAPKERVNIRYKSAGSDQKEDIELPFKMVVVGDFTGRADDTPLEARDRVEINQQNFSDVMKAQRLSINLRVPNKLSEDADASDIDLKLNLDDIRAFEPDRIVHQVPELQKLLQLREALVALKGPLGNVPAFRRAMQNLIADPSVREKLMGELTTKS